MLAHHSYRIQTDIKEICIKGTLALGVTLLSLVLFGKPNMMIAFVIILGSSTLTLQNFRVKLVQKTIKLILIDEVIVILAYIADSLGKQAILLNFIVIFLIIYVTMSPYDQRSYKTFMMLYAFCQYTKIPLDQLQKRMEMVVFVVVLMIIIDYIQKGKNKSLLPDCISKAFELLNLQLDKMIAGTFDDTLYKQVYEQMQHLAYDIYRTSYGRYFTTYLGKVQFHFYLNISYFNILTYELNLQYNKGYIDKKQVTKLQEVTAKMNTYFKRQITRIQLINYLKVYLDAQVYNTLDEQNGNIMAEIREAIYGLYKNFQELEDLNKKWNNKIYSEWSTSNLNNFHNRFKEHFNPKSIGFNFALRMSIVLSIMLLLAGILGFYKFIWAIIPIMSIAQPYYEDTKIRRNDRILSNVLAALLTTVLLSITNKWIGFFILVAAFYLLFAYKDYYYYSFFITIISMCISAAQTKARILLVYRIIYVLIGAAIVTIITRIWPYHVKDGIDELVKEGEYLNTLMEEESIKLRHNKGNLKIIREGIIRSAILCQKLQLKNKQYKSEEITKHIVMNTEFAIRLGHCVLKYNDNR